MVTAKEILRKHLVTEWFYGGDAEKAILSAMEEYSEAKQGNLYEIIVSEIIEEYKNEYKPVTREDIVKMLSQKYTITKK